jgi:hypothetical protein
MVSLTAKLVRSLVCVAAFAIAAVSIAPGCTYHRCDNERRRCDEGCFYRCDRSGCYPVCEVRCRTYCADRYSGSASDLTSSEAVTPDDLTTNRAPAGAQCKYDDECSSGLRCVEDDGKEPRVCEARL